MNNYNMKQIKMIVDVGQHFKNIGRIEYIKRSYKDE